MAGILVYLPGHGDADLSAEFTRLGLADLLDRSVAAIPVPLAQGPDGAAGRLVIFDGLHLPPTPPNFEPEHQEWLEAPPDGDLEKGRYWVGYVKGQKPTPSELQRNELHVGEEVILRDGNSWAIPDADYLPKRLTRDRNTGAEVREVTEAHRQFVHQANSIYEWLLSDGFSKAMEKDVVMQIPGSLGFCAAALAKNYRVNCDVVDLLDLIGEYEAWDVVKVVTGFSATMRALSEKKSMGSSFPPTSERSTPNCMPEVCNGRTISQPSST